MARCTLTSYYTTIQQVTVKKAPIKRLLKPATVGSGQPWVPHGDKASQPRPEQWLNACMRTVGTLR